MRSAGGQKWTAKIPALKDFSSSPGVVEDLQDRETLPFFPVFGLGTV